MSRPEAIYGHLRNKTGKHRARDLQSEIFRKGFAMRLLRLKRPKSLQDIGDNKTNDVRQDAGPEWRNAASYENVDQKHEETRDANTDARETQQSCQIGAICHERARLWWVDGTNQVAGPVVPAVEPNSFKHGCGRREVRGDFGRTPAGRALRSPAGKIIVGARPFAELFADLWHAVFPLATVGGASVRLESQGRRHAPQR